MAEVTLRSICILLGVNKLKYTPIIIGSCPNKRCRGIASVDFITSYRQCPDCKADIENYALFEDLMDSQYLRDALNNVSEVLNKLTQGEIPPRLWKSTLLKIQASIQEVVAEEEEIISEEIEVPIADIDIEKEDNTC